MLTSICEFPYPSLSLDTGVHVWTKSRARKGRWMKMKQGGSGSWGWFGNLVKRVVKAPLDLLQQHPHLLIFRYHSPTTTHHFPPTTNHPFQTLNHQLLTPTQHHPSPNLARHIFQNRNPPSKDAIHSEIEREIIIIKSKSCYLPIYLQSFP